MTNTNIVQAIPFMAFWDALNAALRDRGHPEIGFGEARVYFDLAHETKATMREQDNIRRIKNAVGAA